MYAIFKTGGKQYKVQEGDVIKVEKLEYEDGADVSFADVLYVGGDGAETKIGNPLVPGVQINAKVLKQGKGPKIFILKFRHRKNYKRKTGHRQPFTELKITGIAL